ncbi:MAG: transposase [Chloroflexi bacterium]|nr:transposase [Chloroflexota bacterium]
MPPDYGDWKNTHRRYSRWRDNGVWERILEALIDEPDFEWLMIDAGYVKVNTHGMPVRMKATVGTVADSSKTMELI